MRQLWTIALGVAGTAILLLSLRARAKDAPPAPTPPPAAPAGPWRVLALGDSLTKTPGYETSLRSGLGPGSSVVCVGFVGQGVSVVAGGMEQAREMGATDVVILAGVNDLASGRPLSVIEQNLQGMHVLRLSSVQVVFCVAA